MLFKSTKNQDKLFHALVDNKDTIYVLYNPKEEKVIYTTKNIKDVLGLEIDYARETTQTIKDILNIPILKNELESWNKKEEFVSGMIAYRNLKYQHNRWIRVKIYPIFEKKEKHYVILISDATSEHDRQHLLVQQASDIKLREQQLNQITAISYDIEMTIQASTGAFTLRNLKETNNFFGKNRTGFYEKELEDIITTYVFDEDIKQINEKIEEVKNIAKDDSDKEVEPLEVRYRLNDEKTTLESMIFYSKSKTGNTITILTKDVTENTEYIKRQNALLEKALKEAEEANKAKSEFLSIMSHEIRSPMNVIIGLSESVLQKDTLDSDTKEDIDAINTASNNLLDVIDGLLDISKIESGESTLEEKEYDLATFIKSLEKYTKAKLKNNKVALEVAVDPSIPSTLYGDSSKLRQILQNILNNAVQYTEKGNIIIKVNWIGNKETGKLKFEVTDTGKGIDEKKLKTLFQDKENKKKYQSGMGLYIAKKYIDELNGEIEVTSTPKVGSTFTITINQKVINENKIGDIYSHQTKKNLVTAFDANGAKILIVDDDNLNIKVATRLLKPYNVDITAVTSGKEALKLLDTNTFDLILLDQMMPEMSGTETLHQMQEKEITIPTVMLTADAMVGKKELYLKAGFNDYLSKPINTEELNKILKKYLEK